MDVHILPPTRQCSVPTRPLNLSSHTCSQFRHRFHLRDFTETWLQCVFPTPLLHPGNTQKLSLILSQSSLPNASWRLLPGPCLPASSTPICCSCRAVCIYFSAPSFCVLRSSRRVLVPGLDAEAVNEDGQVGLHKKYFFKSHEDNINKIQSLKREKN